MNINDVMTAISTLGFPIVMCGALFWKMLRQDEQHKEEMDKLSEALNNNTLALSKLTDKLEGSGKE